MMCSAMVWINVLEESEAMRENPNRTKSLELSEAVSFSKLLDIMFRNNGIKTEAEIPIKTFFRNEGKSFSGESFLNDLLTCYGFMAYDMFMQSPSYLTLKISKSRYPEK